ncbi:MAG: M48 family metallopeptidase, partial [Erysipelothrix sp.]|nr:M48 family metallopeptidase [Erysipelothrix sp.]
WGSCLIKDETIVLNNDLIYAPKACIDYVVLHELIHFIEKDHNSHFYNLMYLLMPDWEQRKKYLDEEMIVNI